MSRRCPPPHRLAAFEAGRLTGRRAAALEDHLASCAACTGARARVRVANAGLRAARSMQLPELGAMRGEALVRWARIERLPVVRRPFLLALGLCGSAAVVLLLLAGRPAPPSGPASPSARAPAGRAPLSAMLTLLGGQVALSRQGRTAPLSPSATLRAGDALSTGPDGRVAAQWAEGCGFRMDPAGQLALERLDEGAERLALDAGRVVVRVASRAQRDTSVLTPSHAVRVRGTWFAVAVAGLETTVEVFEGTVEVSERGGGPVLLLSAPSRGVFGRGRASARALEARPARAARERAPLALQAFADLQSALDASGLITITSTPEGSVRFDGEEQGATPLVIRRPLGRHLVELGQRAFQPLRRWVEIGSEPGELRVALSPRSPPEPDSAPVEVEEMVRRRGSQIRACYERSLKRDPELAGTVSLRLQVGDAGQVTTARIDSSTLVDPRVGECLRREALGWSFRVGRNAAVVYPFVFRPSAEGERGAETSAID